ncbi:MAG: beta-glucosidase BglX [Pseudomonadales bacterium]
MFNKLISCLLLAILLSSASISQAAADQRPEQIEQQISKLLTEMTLVEKIGQMALVNIGASEVPAATQQDIRDGKVGSILNEVDVNKVNALQRLAVEESRMGIPLLVGRDVIHGFKTIFPLPLGQAASWNPKLVEQAARISALEAAKSGVNWTFAPMIDISRDPRWGRIAESLGEDPYLSSVLGTAMIRGFQGNDLADKGSIAASAKHLAGYGAAESGLDYNSVDMSEQKLRNVYLPPFKAAAEAGVASIMTSFNDLNGIPSTGNEHLLKQILRREWEYPGFVVSDWQSVGQLTMHGFTTNDKEAAYEAANAGVDMEMAGTMYADNLKLLIEEDRISLQQIDSMVANILRIKIQLGLFNNPYTKASDFPELVNAEHLQAAKVSAMQSVVLLKNSHHTLPLDKHQISSLAVIGPMADDPYEQLGTWIFDGDPLHSQTPLMALKKHAGDGIQLRYAKGLQTTRTKNRDGFAEAVRIASQSDVVIMFMGEESILSGEAHSRADIDLPGYQQQLISEIAATGKPVILVVMAGRPLTIEQPANSVAAILYAWHPGTMGGPAIADLLFGVESPSGKLPVTFPRMVGQIPIYYARKNTGKPATDETVVHIDDIEVRAKQTSFGMTSFYLDAGHRPLYPFGYGLSYSEFSYDNIQTSTKQLKLGETIQITAELTNTGETEAEEVAQLYIRDLVGNITRPIKELKGFIKIRLKPGETQIINFQLHTDDLAFYNRKMELAAEPGAFYAWIGGSSEATLKTEFHITK